MTDGGRHYWSLDVPGLSEAKARHLASVIENIGAGHHVILSDPRLFLTLHVDRATVEPLRRTLATVLLKGVAGQDAAILSGLLEEFDEWLDIAEVLLDPG